MVAVVLVVSAAAAGALSGMSMTGLVTACAAAGSLAVLHASIAFAAGAATGRRAIALGTATTIAAAGYLVHGLLGVTDIMEPLRFLSPWHWYLGRKMLAHGPALGAVAVPLGMSGLLFLAGLVRFERRDLR